MKRVNSLIIITLVLLLCHSACTNKRSDNTAVLAGKIADNCIDTLFYKIPIILGAGFKELAIPVNEDGYFHVKIEMDTVEEAILTNGKSFLRTYLEPGDSLFLATEAIPFFEKAQFSGIGAEKHSYLKEKEQLFRARKEEGLTELFKMQDEVGLFDFVANVNQSQLETLEQFNKKHPFSTRFLNNQRSSIAFSNTFTFMLYFSSKATNNYGKLDTITISKNFYDSYKNYYDVSKEEKQSLAYYDYLYALRSLYSMEEDARSGSFHTSVEVQQREIDIALSRFDGFERECCFAQLFYVTMCNLDSSMYAYFQDTIPMVVKDSSLLTLLQEKRQVIESIVHAEKNPAVVKIVMDTATNNDVGLDELLREYSTKPTYVYIWAPWNYAAREEMTQLKRLKEKYGDAIEIVTVSLYSNIVWWEYVLDYYAIPSDNYLSGPILGEELYKKLDGIPRQMLLNKDGKIVKQNAPSPSDPSLFLEINSLIGR